MPEKIELLATRPQALATIPYFSLQIESKTKALIDMRSAQEVLNIASERITMMPNMPNHVLGLVYHRSRVFWVIDLPLMFGLNPLYGGAAEYPVIIIQIQDFWLGLAGLQSLGVKRFSSEQIAPPDHNISLKILKFLHGCIPETDGISLVLDLKIFAESEIIWPDQNQI